MYKAISETAGKWGRTVIFTKRYDRIFNKDGGNFRASSGRKCFTKSSLPQQNFSESNLAGLSRYNSRCTIGQSASPEKSVVQKSQHSRVLFSKNAAVFRKKLANSNQKPTNYAMGLRPRLSVFKITKSKFTPTSCKNESSIKYLGSGGNTGNVEKGAKVNKPQKFEQLFAIPSFQDGGPTFRKGLVATERLHVQSRLKGCLLLRSTLHKLPEVYTFSRGREPAEFLCLCFRIGQAPRIFTKLIKPQ